MAIKKPLSVYTQGLFLGGGIAPRILPELIIDHEHFRSLFHAVQITARLC